VPAVPVKAPARAPAWKQPQAMRGYVRSAVEQCALFLSRRPGIFLPAAFDQSARLSPGAGLRGRKRRVFPAGSLAASQLRSAAPGGPAPFLAPLLFALLLLASQ